MCGGADLNIEGRKMLRDPSANTVFFGVTGDLTTAISADYDLLASALSENDQFRSNTQSGFLAYTSDPIWTLLGGDYDSFNGEALPNCDVENCNLEVKVASGDWYQNECTSSDDCALKYKRNYTPLLLDVSPANVYSGQRVQFHVYMRNTNDAISDDAYPF